MSDAIMLRLLDMTIDNLRRDINDRIDALPVGASEEAIRAVVMEAIDNHAIIAPEPIIEAPTVIVEAPEEETPPEELEELEERIEALEEELEEEQEPEEPPPPVDIPPAPPEEPDVTPNRTHWWFRPISFGKQSKGE